MRNWTTAFATMVTFLATACCPPVNCDDPGREWTVRGRVLAQDSQTPAVGANVDALLLFAIDSPGNQRAPSATTDTDGRFETTVRIIASCRPSLFCGTEAQATANPPGSVELTVRTGSAAQGFYIDDRAFIESSVEHVPRFGIVGIVELTDVVLNSP